MVKVKSKLKDILHLQDVRFFIVRYALALGLFIWHIWPQFIHDVTRNEAEVGPQFIVLLTELPLNLLIIILLVLYPLANAIGEAWLTEKNIINVRRVCMNLFVKACQNLWQMRKDYSYERDGLKPILKMVVAAILTGLLTVCILYWTIVGYILFGWAIIIVYVAMTELNGRSKQHQ